MPRMTDHDNMTACREMTLGTQVDLENQRARGIQHLKSTLFGIGVNFFGNTMGRKDHHGTCWHFIQLIYKNNTLGLEGIHHELVVHDFVTHIDRRTKFFNSLFHHMDGAVNAGAEASGSCENHFFHDAGSLYGRPKELQQPFIRI